MIFEFGNVKSTVPADVLKAYHTKQVHGTRCVEVTQVGQNCGEADGFWTRVPGLAVRVVTADCVPILAEHRESGAVAALHAGWRGVLGQILGDFFKSLPPELSQPKDWQFKLGPSIRPPCYEVSLEIIERFKTAHPGMNPKQLEPSPRQLDLVAVLQFQLGRLGVNQIEVHPDCTFCSTTLESRSLYRSYRRGDRDSRQVSWIRSKI
jgi:polyphenol oxidase